MLKWILRKIHPPPCPEFDEPWRSVDWSVSNKNTLLETLNKLQLGNSEVNSLRILLYGPIGAGKSSFINSVDSCLQGRSSNKAPSNSEEDDSTSFTLKGKTCQFMDKTGSSYPFSFTDISGIEKDKGIQIDDIIKILHGHIQNDYTFKPVKPISEDDPKYNRHPSLKDKIHCLVSVLPANMISIMDEKVINKMREVREKARDLDIPQVIVMTKIDEICPLIKEDLQKIYTSKKIKEKMEKCSMSLGVPVSYIYPVKNYHEENATNTETDALILDALQNIVNFANDYVRDRVNNE